MSGSGSLCEFVRADELDRQMGEVDLCVDPVAEDTGWSPGRIVNVYDAVESGRAHLPQMKVAD